MLASQNLIRNNPFYPRNPKLKIHVMQKVLQTYHLSIGYKGQALMPAIDVSLNEGDIVALAGPTPNAAPSLASCSPRNLTTSS